MAALLKGNSQQPWQPFTPSDIERKGEEQFVAWVDQRSETAQTLLKQAGFTEAWPDWCNDKTQVMTLDNIMGIIPCVLSFICPGPDGIPVLVDP